MNRKPNVQRRFRSVILCLFSLISNHFLEETLHQRISITHHVPMLEMLFGEIVLDIVSVAMQCQYKRSVWMTTMLLENTTRSMTGITILLPFLTYYWMKALQRRSCHLQTWWHTALDRRVLMITVERLWNYLHCRR